MPQDQQNNQNYSRHGVFWLYNWFKAENNNNMNVFFLLMNGNIFNCTLALQQYGFNGYSANAILRNPPASTYNDKTLHLFCKKQGF
jgi:hypothetical protein